MDDDTKLKKARRIKKCIAKRRLMFETYEDCLFNGKTMLKSQKRFKSDYRNVYTAQIIKIALSSYGDKRLQTLDKTTPYPYGINAVKVCESEMLSKYKWLVLIIMLIVITLI